MTEGNAKAKAPAGWYADPFGRHSMRLWNGSVWTSSVTDDGVESKDPPFHFAAKARLTFAVNPSSDHPQSRRAWLRGNVDVRRFWSILNLIAGVMTILGCWLPWVVGSSFTPTGVQPVTRNGFQLGANLAFSADGVQVAIGGGIVLAIGVFALIRHRFAMWLPALPVVAGIGILQTAVPDLNRILTKLHMVASSGVGIWMVVIGGIVAILGAALPYVFGTIQRPMPGAP